jgi:hypothetical protein
LSAGHSSLLLLEDHGLLLGSGSVVSLLLLLLLLVLVLLVMHRGVNLVANGGDRHSSGTGIVRVCRFGAELLVVSIVIVILVVAHFKGSTTAVHHHRHHFFTFRLFLDREECDEVR